MSEENVNLSSSVASQNEDEYLVRAADSALAVFLIFCVLIALPFNLLSCCYFSTRSPSRQGTSRNTRYFNRLYTLITVVDCLMCVMCVPVIQVLLLPNRQGNHLFNLSPVFCHIWAVLWTLLYQLSVFLVAFISISRLLVIARPHRILRENTALTGPFISCGICAAILLVLPLLILKSPTINYMPDIAMCIMEGGEGEWPANVTVETLVPSENKKVDAIYKVFWSTVMGAPVLPISLSTVMSLLALRHTPSAEGSLHGNKDHKSASHTVMIFTSIYIVFNIPTLIYAIYACLYEWREAQFVRGGVTWEQFDAWEVDTSRVLHPIYPYAFLVVHTVLTVLKATLNPFVYLWRMKNFRSFTNQLMEHDGNSIRVQWTLVSNTD